MEKEKEVTTDCIINLAYYYVFGACLLLNRWERDFARIGLAEKGKTKLMLNTAREKVAGAIKILDTFDDRFIAASQGSIEKYDAYFSVVNELISLNLLYLGHAYENTDASKKVFEMIKGLGLPNDILDNLSESYLEKSLNV